MFSSFFLLFQREFIQAQTDKECDPSYLSDFDL